MRILFLFGVFSLVAFLNIGKTQLSAIGFYDSLHVMGHPEIIKYGDSIIRNFENAMNKDILEMEKELDRKQTYYEIYRDSTGRFIGCGLSIMKNSDVLESKRLDLTNDLKILDSLLHRWVLEDLHVILNEISERDSLVSISDKSGLSDEEQTLFYDYTDEILRELIRLGPSHWIIDDGKQSVREVGE